MDDWKFTFEWSEVNHPRGLLLAICRVLGLRTKDAGEMARCLEQIVGRRYAKIHMQSLIFGGAGPDDRDYFRKVASGEFDPDVDVVEYEIDWTKKNPLG